MLYFRLYICSVMLQLLYCFRIIPEPSSAHWHVILVIRVSWNSENACSSLWIVMVTVNPRILLLLRGALCWICCVRIHICVYEILSRIWGFAIKINVKERYKTWANFFRIEMNYIRKFWAPLHNILFIEILNDIHIFHFIFSPSLFAVAMRFFPTIQIMFGNIFLPFNANNVFSHYIDAS